MKTREDIEWYWEHELGQEVEILVRGWLERPTDFALYISGTFVVAYKNIEEIEEYLERYFMVNGE